MDPSPQATRLDQPLPVELTGTTHGWLTRYRRYPVFGPPWTRLRWRLVGLALTCVFVPLALLVGSHPPLDRPWPGLAELALTLLVPAIVGPWLGGWVRRRGWPAAREGMALTVVVGLILAASATFYIAAAEPFKQFVAERTGIVDEHGKRRRVALTFGINIITPEPRTDAPLPEPHDNPWVLALSLALRLGLAFLLCGGLALRAWRREQDGLAALARERALAQAQAERREAELRLSVLAAQVEPHFLFNTLAGVRGAIASDPARAREMVERLVEYLRASIPRLRGDGVEQATLGAQLEIVRAYLGLMAARMPRLRYTVDAPPELLALPFPPLMLISLAENAVKHGIEPKIGPARIDVSARRTDDGRLEVTVADDGAGFGDATGSGLGLANIRERLQQMYQGRATLSLAAGAQGGVTATLALPLE